MNTVFNSTASFGGGMSKWVASKVIGMDYMFWQATSYKQLLCRTSWVSPKASRIGMFTGDCSSGPHGPIGERDVSSVFVHNCLMATYRNGTCQEDVPGYGQGTVCHLEKWGISDVAFSGDLSVWDVSSASYIANPIFLSGMYSRSIAHLEV